MPPGDAALYIFNLRECCAALIEIQTTVIGQLNAARGAAKQLKPQALFKPPNTAAHCCGRKAQRLCGGSEPTQLCGLAKNSNRAELGGQVILGWLHCSEGSDDWMLSDYVHYTR